MEKNSKREEVIMGIYFIEQDCDGGYMKIGVAGNVSKRMYGLQCASPHKLNLIGFYNIHKPFTEIQIEQALHKFFKAARMRGEWFRPSCYMYDFIGRASRIGVVKALQERTTLEYGTEALWGIRDFGNAYNTFYKTARSLWGYGDLETLGYMIRETEELVSDLKRRYYANYRRK